MKVYREISYNNPKIANFIYNLRKLISCAVSERLRELYKREDELFTTWLQQSREKDLEHNAEPVNGREPLELTSIRDHSKYLLWTLKNSICECCSCGKYDKPMVYRNAGGKRWMCKECSDDFFKDEFVINDFLSVVYEWGDIYITIKGERFRICNLSVVTLPINILEKEYSNMDEFLDKNVEDINKYYRISKKTEYWVYCSSLQVWVENKFDTHLLHRNVAFPLLEGLYRVGDPIAKKVFREEIVKRYLSGNHNVRRFLRMNGFLSHLDKEEIKFILDDQDQNSNFKIFKRNGRHVCNLCKRFKSNLNIFGNNLEEAEDTLSLCDECLRLMK